MKNLKKNIVLLSQNEWRDKEKLMTDNSKNDLTHSNSIEIEKWANDFESTKPFKDFPKSIKKTIKQEQSPTNNCRS